MTLLQRIRGGLKAFALTFTGRTSSGSWATWGSKGSYDWRSVGDGTGNSIVAATLGWIARNFPEAPIRIREKDDKGEWTTTDDPGALRMVEVLRNPNVYFSGILLWMATIVDFWVHGNAFWVKVRGGPGGAITELWWIPWALVEPKWPKDGSEYLSHYIYKPDGTKEIRVEIEDAIHFRYGLDPDNIRIGKSPITAVLREVFTDDEAASFTATLLKNLGVPGVIITPDDEEAIIGGTDAEDLKATFKDRFSGDSRGEPMITSAKVKVSVLSFSPQQMDLKALRRIPEERVSAVTGVPAIVAGLGAGLDRSTFANFAEAREAGYEENLIPTQRILASQIDRQLTPEFVADPGAFLTDFDTTEVRVLQEDQNALWTRAADAASKGLITLAAFKQQVGLEVDEANDRIYLRAFNVVAVPEDEQLPSTEPGTPTAQEVEQPPAESTNGHVTDEEAGGLLEALAEA